MIRVLRELQTNGKWEEQRQLKPAVVHATSGKLLPLATKSRADQVFALLPCSDEPRLSGSKLESMLMLRSQTPAQRKQPASGARPSWRSACACEESRSEHTTKRNRHVLWPKALTAPVPLASTPSASVPVRHKGQQQAFRGLSACWSDSTAMPDRRGRAAAERV